MQLVNGQKLTLQVKKRNINGEIVDSTLLNNGDRHFHSKRDSNPVFKVTVRVPELKLMVTQQVEMTDRIQEDIKNLEELFSTALAHGEGHPYK